jgi:hypothetical protein
VTNLTTKKNWPGRQERKRKTILKENEKSAGVWLWIQVGLIVGVLLFLLVNNKWWPELYCQYYKRIRIVSLHQRAHKIYLLLP